jgi:Putative transmembrane protein (PGPGW)
MKKIITALIGGTVLLFGIALLVLPGPGLPVVAAGLAILTTKFLWARRALRNAKGAVAKTRRKFGLRGWLRRCCVRQATIHS